jgi:hypothetical protein
VKLAHDWTATFDDTRHRVLLTKPSRSAPMHLVWIPPHLKPIDPVSGVYMSGLTTMLPDVVRVDLELAAMERWK